MHGVDVVNMVRDSFIHLVDAKNNWNQFAELNHQVVGVYESTLVEMVKVLKRKKSELW